MAWVFAVPMVASVVLLVVGSITGNGLFQHWMVGNAV